MSSGSRPPTLQPSREFRVRGLGSPHLQPKGLSRLRQGNAEGLLQTNAVRACAASLPPRRLRAPDAPKRVYAVVSCRARAPRVWVRRGAARVDRHQLSDSSGARAQEGPARRWLGRGLTWCGGVQGTALCPCRGSFSRERLKAPSYCCHGGARRRHVKMGTVLYLDGCCLGHNTYTHLW